MATRKKSLRAGKEQRTRKPMTAPQIEALKRNQFKPGVSGNPSGKRKTMLLSEAMRNQLEMIDPKDKEGRTFAEVIAEKMVREALAGKVQAVSELADRTEGRPAQQVKLSNPNGGPVEFMNCTPEENDEAILAIIYGASSADDEKGSKRRSAGQRSKEST